MRAWIDEGPEREAIYAKLLPGIRTVAWQLGYSLGLHGSMRRDLDLIAAPWIEAAASPEQLVDAIAAEIAGEPRGKPSKRPHGRLAYSIHLVEVCVHMYVDLSVMPRADQVR